MKKSLLIRIVVVLVIGFTISYLSSTYITKTNIDFLGKEHISLSISYGLIFFIFFENLFPLFSEKNKKEAN